MPRRQDRGLFADIGRFNRKHVVRINIKAGATKRFGVGKAVSVHESFRLRTAHAEHGRFVVKKLQKLHHAGHEFADIIYRVLQAKTEHVKGNGQGIENFTEKFHMFLLFGPPVFLRRRDHVRQRQNNSVEAVFHIRLKQLPVAFAFIDIKMIQRRHAASQAIQLKGFGNRLIVHNVADIVGCGVQLAAQVGYCIIGPQRQ